jgi:hypothetical protein
MARSDNKDPRLSEVKAVLQRLQGFETEPDPPSAMASAVAVPRSGHGTAVVTGTVILATAAGLLGAAYIFVRAKDPDPAPARPIGAEESIVQAAAAPPSPPPDVEGPTAVTRRLDLADAKAALEGARALMAKGKVRAAREQLLVLANRGSLDAAWDLARSFDPNVLMGLPADASPDVKEATRWYRTWYTAAVREGLVADSVSLERIIGSMRH